MDSLPWGVVGPGSGWAAFIALAFIVVRAFIKGAIVPRATLTDRITESRIKDQQLLEKDIQLRHMEEVGKTVNRIMRAIDRGPRSGKGDS